ncbi:MAG: cytochrome c oxidase subunit II [Planctomycetaceae bacterium]
MPRQSSTRLFKSIACAGAAAITALGGCQGERVQSALHPSGPAADSVARLWWVLLVVLGGYSVAVFGLTLFAIFRQPRESEAPARDGRRFILIGGVILPALILVPMLIYSLSATAALRMRESGLTIRVVGHRWWWEVQYPDHDIAIANELYIPSGEPVRLELTSADVIHSFWVPQLQGKMDMMPGQTTAFWIQADKPGRYRGQCAEYCGLQHAHMAFVVEALPPERFVDWINRQQAGESKTLSAELQRGQDLFFKHGCAVCHAIEETDARGTAGPDLTRFAFRQTLAAGTLPNTTDNLLAWLADPQSIKPGANMPPTHATAEELKAIAAYLQSLGEEGSGRDSTE